MFRTFLLDYGLICIWVISLLELLLTGFLFIDYKAKRDPAILWMALLGVGLCYDAAIIGLGGMILPPVLPMFSRVRFVLHGLLLPLNLVICAYSLPFYRKPRIATWVLTGILMALGAAGLEEPAIASRFVRMIRENHDGMIECKDLLRANAQLGKEKKPHCDAMVYEAVEAVETILREEGILTSIS